MMKRRVCLYAAAILAVFLMGCPRLVVVPETTGLPRASAEAAIANAGLIVGVVSEEHSATVLAGNVIRQNPAAGETVKANTAVDLVMSLGPEGTEGEGEGAEEGEMEGAGEGQAEGQAEGQTEGETEGANEGEEEGEPVLFTVGNPEDLSQGTYILPLYKKADIAHARAIIAHPGEAGPSIVAAKIGKGSSDGTYYNCDPNNGYALWSWHVSEFLGFEQATAELLDGSARYVEEHLSAWMAETGGQIGFWSYRVMGELVPNFLERWVPTEPVFDGAVNVVARYMEGDYGVAIVEVPYLDVFGNGKVGLAQVILRKQEGVSGALVPVFFHAYYTLDMLDAQHWCDRGWAVVTEMNTGTGGNYPLGLAGGDGVNQARATFQWIRRLPYVDRTHIHVDGTSQGGFVALDLGAEMFPVTSLTANNPLVNWSYCLGYVEANKGPARYPEVSTEDSPIPLLHSVCFITEWNYLYFGSNFTSDTWYTLSPISYVDRITAPALITCATGDVLLPMEQMSATHFRPFNPDDFPSGYIRDFDTLTLNAKSKVHFEDLLPAGQYFIQVLTPQEGAYEIIPEYYTPGKASVSVPAGGDKPWSPEAQWSLLYLDEGAPMPYSGHTRYTWWMYPDSFTEYYKTHPPSPDLLNAPKLHRLMERYTFTLENLPRLAKGQAAVRLNMPGPERLDVLQGLLDYATICNEHEQRLITLYNAGKLKPLGSTISIASIQEELSALFN